MPPAVLLLLCRPCGRSPTFQALRILLVVLEHQKEGIEGRDHQVPQADVRTDIPEADSWCMDKVVAKVRNEAVFHRRGTDAVEAEGEESEVGTRKWASCPS